MLYAFVACITDAHPSKGIMLYLGNNLEYNFRSILLSGVPSTNNTPCLLPNISSNKSSEKSFESNNS